MIFVQNSGYIVCYALFIWHKFLTNCNAHLVKSIFHTRSRILHLLQIMTLQVTWSCVVIQIY